MTVDLSGMSEEDRKRYENQIATQRQNSELFNTMYSSLESSENVYTVQFEQTTSEGSTDPVLGQFAPNESGGGSITFLPTNTDIVTDVLSEEFFHAYQHDNKGGYGQGEFNVEFEAKVFNIAVDAELGMGFANYDGMGDFQSNVFLGNYGSGLQVITPNNVTSSGFLNDYTKAANDYAKNNITKNIGNSHYKTSTTVAPYSLQRVIVGAYGK
jgi:hypothetical protein